MRIILSLVVCLAAIIGMGACSSSNGVTGADGRIRVVAVENFWGSLVGQIAGPAADVTSIIANPATDPHDYEPSAADARELASAKYVVVNGIGYDAWAQQLLDANPTSGRTVLDVGDLLGLESGANPHQWYSPSVVRKFVVRVAADLERLVPAHRADIRQRARTLESTGLREYDQLIARIRSQFAGTPIGASESVVSPLASALGLRMMTPESFLDAIAEGNGPTQSDKATVDAQIARHEITVFVYNRQNATPDVQRLVDAARRARIPVATVTETLAPANVSFETWQVRQLRALLAALVTGTLP